MTEITKTVSNDAELAIQTLHLLGGVRKWGKSRQAEAISATLQKAHAPEAFQPEVDQPSLFGRAYQWTYETVQSFYKIFTDCAFKEINKH